MKERSKDVLLFKEEYRSEKMKKKTILIITLIAILVFGFWGIMKFTKPEQDTEEITPIVTVLPTKESSIPRTTEVVDASDAEVHTSTPFPYTDATNPNSILIDNDIDITPAEDEFVMGDVGYNDDIILSEESTWQEKAAFFNEIKDDVLMIAHEYNTNAFVLLALAVENSAHGQLKTVEYNNVFRIKTDDQGINLSLAYKDATGVLIVDEGYFKIYTTKADSIRDMASIMVTLGISNETPDYEALTILSQETEFLYGHYIDYMMTQAGQYRNQFSEEDYDTQINYLDDWGITDKLKELGIVIGD